MVLPCYPYLTNLAIKVFGFSHAIIFPCFYRVTETVFHLPVEVCRVLSAYLLHRTILLALQSEVVVEAVLLKLDIDLLKAHH